MSKIFELPVELFLEIFGYIDKGEDWTTLTCVNREFYNFATGRIWGPIENSEQKQHQVFMWACASGSTRAIRRLLQGGLPIKFTYQSGGMRELYYMTPQIYLDIPQDDFGRGQAFVTNMDAFHPPATIMIHSKSSFWMPLHVAASGGQSEAAETLLEHGADIESPSLNYCNSEFWDLTPVGKFTPLHTAIQEGQIDVANLLISKGASIYVDRVASRPEKTSGPGRGRLTAFHCCAVYDRKSIAETLVNQGYGAAIDEIDEFGYSPLMYASYHDSHDIFEFFLSQGANVRITTTTKRPGVKSNAFRPEFTSLVHQACFDCRIESLDKLIIHRCGLNEPDKNGEQFLLHMMRKFFNTSLIISAGESMDKTLTRLDAAITITKYAGIHAQANMTTLAGAMKIALEAVLTPFVSLLFDETSFSKSILIDPTSLEPILGTMPKMWQPSYLVNRGWWIPGELEPEPEPQPAFRYSDRRAYFLDTGRGGIKQGLLEYSCLHSKFILEMPKLIELLLAKGCLRPGNVYCHVWALKNLACSHHFIDKRDEILLANCAKKICSHLSATLKSEPYEKPALPVDLLYVCVGFGHRPLLDELANTFDFATTNFNETEMWQMFQIATDYRGVHMNDWWQGRQYRRDCLEVLFQVDTNSCLLRHEFTFEGLCRAFLGSDGGEALVMDYLDRGGRYSLTFSTGTTALSQACHTGCLSLAERLIDLGADPDKSLTVGEEDLDTEDILWSRPQDNAKRLAIWRLLLKRGANPFRWHEANENRGFPWQQFTDNSPDDQFLPHLLGDMCRLATDELSDDGDLFEILYVACTRGKYYLIEQMRTRAKGRVDAMIREKAALFLQTLLIRLAPIPDSIPPANGLETISKMDGAIDTIRLILELAPPGILKSSWRLRQGREDFTALKVIRKLLTPPQNPHNHLPVGEACRYEEEHQYKINWCLKQRIQLGSSSTGKAIITILNRRIQWPTEWKLPDAVRFDTEEERYTFDSIKLPWGCDCWDHLLP